MALHSPLHTFLHLACFLPSAEPLHTLISFAWIEASTNILYARRPMLERHLLATTGVMARTHNPNTTQESQKKGKFEASQGASVTPQLFESHSQYARKRAPSDKKGPSRVSFKSCRTRSVAMAVMFTACGAQLTGRVTPWNPGKLRTLGGICKVWEKFFVKQLLFLLPPKFAQTPPFP